MKTKGVNTCKSCLLNTCLLGIRGYATQICHRWRMNRKTKMDPVLQSVPPVEGGGWAVCLFLLVKHPYIQPWACSSVSRTQSRCNRSFSCFHLLRFATIFFSQGKKQKNLVSFVKKYAWPVSK